MPACCDPREYDVVFTSKYATQTARKLRTSGLDDTARRMVDFLVDVGVEGAGVLEIGGGVGGVHLELLRQGASRATNLELSTAYDAEARQLLHEAGVAERVERRIADLAADPEAVPRADVVVLHRVVCCYPDFQRLLAAAADHARHALVLSFPRPHLLTRAGTALENVSYAVRRRSFRTFVHSPEAMVDVLAAHGLRVARTGRTAMWQFAGTVRY
jgi:magnesium-protoporphyrin O-methyltransferase